MRVVDQVPPVRTGDRRSRTAVARWGARAGRLVTLVVSALVLFQVSPALRGPDGAKPSVALVAPAVVELGRTYEIALNLRGGDDVAAYEGSLGFDPTATTYVAARHGHHPVSGRGQLEAMGTTETPGGVAFGAYQCPAPLCAGEAEPRAPGQALTLTTVVLRAEQPGSIQIVPGSVLLVTAEGKQRRVQPKPVVIQVGHEASSPLWAPAAAAAIKHAPGRRASYDVTGDGRVDLADARDVERDWMLSRRDGTQCAGDRPRVDVTGDGCVDVADVQAVATRAGAVARHAADHLSADGRTLRVQLAATGGLTFTVNSTGDGDDVAPGDGICRTAVGDCTWRAAITEANASAGHDTIAFNIPGTGVHTISPGGRMDLTDAAGVTIDGYTQPGSSPNTADVVDNATITIEIKGIGPNDDRGLYVATPYNVIRGLAMYNMPRDVWMYGTGAHDNQVIGSFIGTDSTGTFAATAATPGASGVVLQAGASYNYIGKPSVDSRDVISGNFHNGVVTNDGGTSFNTIQNIIAGLNPSGTAQLANQNQGIDINSGTTDTVVGGTGAGQRNVLSGNMVEGVEVSHDPSTLRNNVVGNFIGTDATGNGAPAWAQNGSHGIHLEGAATCNPCPPDAGNSTVTDNVVVGSQHGGIMIDKGFHDATVARNRVGLTANGTAAPNTYFGIRIEHGSTRNTIGPGNEIAYNNGDAIQLQSIGAEPPDSSSVPTNNNKFTQNSVHDNQGWNVGINLAPFDQANTGGVGDLNSNQAIQMPVLTTTTATSVSGTTCGGCTVEVFVASQPVGSYGSGATYLASGVADSSGGVTVALPSSSTTRVVTATATDANGNSSEFAKNVAVPAGSTSVTAPAAPTGLTATAASSSEIDLSWAASSGATSYKVERSPDQATWTEIATGVTSTTFQNTGLAASTTYYYRVRATNSAGDSPYSNTASATTAAPSVQPPAAPTNLAATTVSFNKIDLSWAGAPGATSYKIERSTNGGAFVQIATGVAGTAYRDSGLSPNTTYTYRVRATNAGGDSAYSNTASATTATKK